jgi:MFS family permease
MGVQPHVAIWILYLTDFRELTLAQVGLFEGFFWAFSMLAEVPTGAFADRFGRRLSFLCAAGIEGVGILAFGLASNLPLLLASYVLWSLGLSFRTGNAQAFLYDSLSAAKRTGEYSRLFGRLNATRIGAAMAGGVLGAAVAGAFTLQTPAFVAVAFYVSALGAAFLMYEPPRSRSREQPLGYVATLREAAAALRRNAAVRYIIMFEIFLSLAMVADFVLVQPFLKEASVPVALFGIVTIPMRLASVGGSLWAYRVAASVGLRRAVGGVLLAVVTGLALLGAVSHLAAFAGLIGVQLALSLAQPSVSAYINDRTEADIRATIMSVVPLGTALAYALCIPLVGLAADAELRLAFAVLAAAIFAGAGVSYLLWLRADAGMPAGAAPLEALTSSA